jgi:hypothetical protein
MDRHVGTVSASHSKDKGVLLNVRYGLRTQSVGATPNL